MNLSQIDPSLVYDGSITEEDIAFYDIKKLPNGELFYIT